MFAYKSRGLIKLTELLNLSRLYFLPCEFQGHESLLPYLLANTLLGR